MELCRLLFPFDPGPLSANRLKGRHWSVEHKENEAADVSVLYWRLAGEPCFKGPVRVLWVLYRGRKMDDDGAMRGIKRVRDLLFAKRIGRFMTEPGPRGSFQGQTIREPGRMLPDDDPRHLVQSAVVQLTDPRWRGNVWTELIVLDAGGEE